MRLVDDDEVLVPVHDADLEGDRPLGGEGAVEPEVAPRDVRLVGGDRPVLADDPALAEHGVDLLGPDGAGVALDEVTARARPPPTRVGGSLSRTGSTPSHWGRGAGGGALCLRLTGRLYKGGSAPSTHG